ncbi:MAG TPA: Crp/Fnr family transcriptional regulator [Nitriliruptoraceae bacterium]|nr:Crp/Fnr family transcriptional regulator [Nitriliruptoraceae bacterium]
MPSGRVVHRQGEPESGLTLVTNGIVRLTVAVGADQELVVRMVGSGDAFGAVSAADGGLHATTATAATDCRMVHVPSAVVQALVADDAAVARLMLAHLSTEVRRAEDRLVQRCSKSTLSRVAARLSALDRGDPILMTQHELADWVGATRESTARSLGELRRAGAVTTARGRIEVVDPDRLLEMAG